MTGCLLVAFFNTTTREVLPPANNWYRGRIERNFQKEV